MAKKTKTVGDVINEKVAQYRKFVQIDLDDKRECPTSDFGWARAYKAELGLDKFIAEQALEAIEKIEEAAANPEKFRCGQCDTMKVRGVWATEKSVFGKGTGGILVCKKCFDDNPHFDREEVAS